MEEIWRPVVGYESHYEVSNLGRVRTAKIMSPASTYGYLHVDLCKNGRKTPKRIHRLVAEAFIGPIGKMTVNHKNGVRHDNSVDNLEIVSMSDNLKHSREVLNRPRKSNQGFSKEQVRRIRELKEAGATTREIARMFGVLDVVIWRVVTRRSYKALP